MRLLNIKQSAAMLKVSQNKVFNLIFSGKLKAVKDKSWYYIPESEIGKYLDNKQ